MTSSTNTFLKVLIFCMAALSLSACGGSGSSNNNAVSIDVPTIFYAHSVAFRNSTTVAWGYNANGQLGIGSGNAQSRAVTVKGGAFPGPVLVGMDGIAVGGNHTLAFKNLSGVYAWGNNAYGQLGNGNTDVKDKPVAVSNLTGVTAVAAGLSHSLALRSDGTVWAWGYNGFGQLGDNTTSRKDSPIQVGGPGSAVPLPTLIGVAAGGSHSLAWDDSIPGHVWAWGYNKYGQLGDGTTTDRFIPTGFVLPGGKKILDAAAGGSTSAAVDEDGNVYMWGYNVFGQVGVQPPLDPALQHVPLPRLLDNNGNGLSFFPRKIVKISIGLDHCLALDEDGNVWSWGYNGYGQLGRFIPSSGPGDPGHWYVVQPNPDASANPIPQPVAGLPQITAIRAIGHHSLAVDVNGKVWAWGYNAFNQLGDGGTTSRSEPRIVSGY